MSEPASVTTDPYPELVRLIDGADADAVAVFLRLLAPEDTTYTLSHLPADKRTQMLSMLASDHAEFVADLMEHFPDGQTADFIEELEPDEAAAIVDQMDSDEQVDVLAEIAEPEAQAILEEMDPEEAADVRSRLGFSSDVAGGLMITEYLHFPDDQDVRKVCRELRKRGNEYAEYEVRYIYATDRAGRLRGVVPTRQLLLNEKSAPLAAFMNTDPVTVGVDTPLDHLEDVFDRVDFSALPVKDPAGKLVGVVQRAAVQEALADQSAGEFLRFGGIIGGEELRNVPSWKRAPRRLVYLIPNVGLALVAASVIALFEETIDGMPAIVIFLPMVAALCGSSGNQSIAVSIRELSLGLIQPRDVMRIARQEVLVGLINGVALGAVLALVVFLMRPSLGEAALLIGGSFVAGSVVSVIVGGTVPLILKRLGIDPAMISSPLLATVSDTFVFFIILGGAALFIV